MFFLKFWFKNLIKAFKRQSDYLPHVYCLTCGHKTIMKFNDKLKLKISDGICVTCCTEWYEYKSIRFGSRTQVDDRINQLIGDYVFRSAFPLPEKIYPCAEEYKVPVVKKIELKLIKSKSIPMKITVPAVNILPEDYIECSECGYDHKYDATAANRKHL